MKSSNTDKPDYESQGHEKPSGLPTSSSSESDESDSNGTSGSSSSDEDERTNNDSDSSTSSSSDSSESTSSSSEDKTTDSQAQHTEEDAPTSAPVSPTVNVNYEASSSTRKECASDCASDNGFEGFASPTVKKFPEAIDLLSSESKPKVSVKVTNLEDDSESEDSNSSSAYEWIVTNDINSDTNTTTGVESESDSETNRKGRKSLKSNAKPGTAVRIHSSASDSLMLLSEQAAAMTKVDTKIETIVLEDDEESSALNDGQNIRTTTTSEEPDTAQQSSVNEKEDKTSLSIVDNNLSTKTNSDETKSQQQSVAELTKAAIGEVVDACNEECDNSSKLPNNVIKKMINKEDGMVVGGSSKLSNLGCLPSLKSLNRAGSDSTGNSSLNAAKSSGNDTLRQQTIKCEAINLPKISASSQKANFQKQKTDIIEVNESGDISSHKTEASETCALDNEAVSPSVPNDASNSLAAPPSIVTPSSKGVESMATVEEDGYLPIQAEVVMSDGTDGTNSPCSLSDAPLRGIQNLVNGALMGLNPSNRTKKYGNITVDDPQLAQYLESFVGGSMPEGSKLLRFHPASNELPQPCPNLTQWQLDSVQLPAFMPSQHNTPQWIRLTIPPEGYRCHNCNDTYFLQSSVEAHMQRRTVLIRLECGPCDARLVFYNKCALREHLREHIMRGEEVDEDTVEVRSLPIHMTPLLQPYCTPVPKASQVTDIEKRLSNGSSTDISKHMVRCYMCERIFYTVRELMSHMRTDQPYSDKRVECRKCQMILPSVCAAKAHILTHPPANSANISVCPECGTCCNSPKDFVQHINSCGHQLRKCGVICSECQVCFFRNTEDFLTHWVKDHCNKNYECLVCGQLFESLVFHSCCSPGQQVLATFKCVLACPMCDVTVVVNTHEQDLMHSKVREHLDRYHSKIINRVYYVFKSKFCSNAFRSKDELRAHHDREHRRDNHYRTKTCSLHHTVMAAQHQYSLTSADAVNDLNTFITIPVILSVDEKEDAQSKDIPTVTSILDKTIFPDSSSVSIQHVTYVDGVKVDALTGEVLEPSPSSSSSLMVADGPAMMGGAHLSPTDNSSPCSPYVCYRCGMTHTERKRHKRHVRGCTGEVRERVCRVCQNSYKGDDFVAHCKQHMQQGVILCMLCNGAQFDSIQKLQVHFEKHAHEQFVYPAVCPFCGIILSDVPSSLNHLHDKHSLALSHGTEVVRDVSFPITSEAPIVPSAPVDNSVTCDKCGRKFQGGRALSVHQLSCSVVGGSSSSAGCATGGRQCQACSRSLTSDTLGKHMATHLQEGLVVCSLCDGKPIASTLDLLHHLEAHTTSFTFPYNCVMCQMQLEDQTTALKHLKEEHGLGNLPCPECDMSYTFIQQLSRHTEIVHRICQYAKRRYICWICRAYDHVKKDTLMNHFQLIHGLDRTQVDEKAMIRTRGQGTMPTAQFVPTKQVKKRETKADKSPNKPTIIEKFNSPPRNTPNLRQQEDAEESLDVSDVSKLSAHASQSVVTEPSTAVSSAPCILLKVPHPPVSSSASTINTTAATIVSASSSKTASETHDEKGLQNPNTKPSQKIIKVDIKEAFLKQPPKITKVKLKPAANNLDQSAKMSPAASVASSPAATVPGPVSTDTSKDFSNAGGNVSKLKLTIASSLSNKRKLEQISSDSETASVKSESSNSSSVVGKKKKTKAHRCEKCNFATNFRDKLERHKQKHLDGSLTGFICQECGQSFVVQQSLVRHMFFAHKTKLPAESSVAADIKDEANVIQSGTEVVTTVKRRTSAVGTEKKVKIEVNDGETKVVKKLESTCPKSIPKITATPLLQQVKETKDEVGSGSTVSISNTNTNVTTPTSSQGGIKKLTVLSVTPKSVNFSDGINKLAGASTGKSLPLKPIVIGKTSIQSIVTNVTKATTVLDKPLHLTRAPIKITSSSIVSVVSDKINAGRSTNTLVTPSKAASTLKLSSDTTPLSSSPTVHTPSIAMGDSNKLLTEASPKVTISITLASPPSTTTITESHPVTTTIKPSGSQVIKTSIPLTLKPSVTAPSKLVCKSPVISIRGAIASSTTVTTSQSSDNNGVSTSQVTSVTPKILTSSPAVATTFRLVTAAPGAASIMKTSFTSTLSTSSGTVKTVVGAPAASVTSGSSNSFPCHVCGEIFTSEVEQYSHMRSHGMAFLQMGRKKRLSSGTSSSQD